jgi:hypothetical protein
MTAFDSLLARRLEIPRSRLWIAGNQINGKQAAVITVIGGTAAWLCIFLSPYFGFSVWRSIDDIWTVPLLFCVLFDACSMSMAIHWSRRHSFWQMELLRPHSRKEFVRQVFLAVARDFGPIFLGQFLVTVMLILSCLRFHPHLDWIAGVLLWFILRATTYYTITLFLMIRRPSLWTKFSCAVCIAFILWTGFRLIDPKAEYASLINPQIVGLVIVALSFVALRQSWLIAELERPVR